MHESSAEAVGSSTPTEPRHTLLFQGEWCARGGFVGKRGGFAVLQSRSGLTAMLDRRAVELAALALGLSVVDPLAGKIRTVCAWGGGLMVEGALDANGMESSGLCPCCRKRQFGR